MVLSLTQELFSCGTSDAQTQLKEACASRRSFYEKLALANNNTKITCFVYDSGAYGLLPSSSAGNADAQSPQTAFCPRKPRHSIFGTYVPRQQGMTDVEYIMQMPTAPRAAPTTLRLVLSEGAVSSALFFPVWSKFTSNQRGVYQNVKADVCLMDAGSAVDPSVIFPLNRTYSLLSGCCAFISWDLASASHSDGSNMLPEDLFSENTPLQCLLSKGIIKPSILHVEKGQSAFFRCGSIVSVVAINQSSICPTH